MVIHSILTTWGLVHIWEYTVCVGGFPVCEVGGSWPQCDIIGNETNMADLSSALLPSERPSRSLKTLSQWFGFFSSSLLAHKSICSIFACSAYAKRQICMQLIRQFLWHFYVSAIHLAQGHFSVQPGDQMIKSQLPPSPLLVRHGSQ